ncbi:MAG: hypothetical protein ACYDEF_10940 [Methanosarcina sp.]|nr:hypothetical protein BGV40_00605 [Methanosarcina sp. Ant1]
MSKIIIKTLRPVLGSDILQTMGAPIASTINRFIIYEIFNELSILILILYMQKVFFYLTRSVDAYGVINASFSSEILIVKKQLFDGHTNWL